MSGSQKSKKRGSKINAPGVKNQCSGSQKLNAGVKNQWSVTDAPVALIASKTHGIDAVTS
jgi:hypothetical protein